MVDKKVVNIPSYVVYVNEENKIEVLAKPLKEVSAKKEEMP